MAMHAAVVHAVGIQQADVVGKLLGTPGDAGYERTVDIVTTVVGPVFNDGPWIWSVGKPRDHANPSSADGHHCETIVGELRHLHHASDHTYLASRLAATHLTAAVDQHDSELVIGCFDAIAHQRLIARLEHVQRQRPAGKQHTAEREHRQRAHARLPRAEISGGWPTRIVGEDLGHVFPYRLILRRVGNCLSVE